MERQHIRKFLNSSLLRRHDQADDLLGTLLIALFPYPASCAVLLPHEVRPTNPNLLSPSHRDTFTHHTLPTRQRTQLSGFQIVPHSLTFAAVSLPSYRCRKIGYYP